MQQEAAEFIVLAAHVVGAHGVGGNVRLKLVGETSDAAIRSLQNSSHVKLVTQNSDAERIVTLSSLRKQPGPKGGYLAHFKEIKDRDEAETLIGQSVFIPESARAGLPTDHYYVDQLLGLQMVTDTGKSLGKLAEVIHSPANDVYETDTGILVPAVPAFILDIDLNAQKIVVHEIPGLLDNA